MAGRRLVDAAKLFNASRGVAQKHIALRTSQWDAYNKTSSLAKAVKDQTDRITLTAAAAIALSQRFSEEAPAYAKAAADRATSTQWTPQDKIPRRDTVERKVPAQGVRDGAEQDHHYERSGQNTAQSPPPTEELEVEQEKAPRSPLPDGTIPSRGLTLGQEKGQDTFSERPAHEAPKEPLARDQSGNARHEDEGIKPVESSKSTIPLPGHPRGNHTQVTRSIPAHAKDPQRTPLSAQAEKLQKGHDRDVFYTRSAEVQPSDIPEGINTDVFHSKRVARMLGSDPFSRKEYAQRTTGGRHPLDDRPLPVSERPSQASASPKPAQQSKSVAASEDMEKFASQLVQDAQSNTEVCLLPY
ncbi:hypothetical protein Ptr902_01484 [Pyrenophora tritici-repentis]|uniref:Uncharacterized protein n=1 Tax=Pyrenophora tritici-repentis TaxID=45151 RepID=A0A834S7W4_9PLEO|nr:hypothetical protein PtrM4_014820 [Pyrenophora tritici-repentis]KAI2487351.1 hypothetical protein Ptr902_01484 [Pyrenophora tritici-repentis]